MRNKKYYLIVSIVVIVCSLYYAFKDVTFSEITRALISIHLIYILPAVIMIALSYLLRAMRWRCLIASIKEVKTANLFSPLMIGFMGNMLPARAGEFIRAYLLGKREHISFTSSFATIFIERLFDLFLVLLLLLFVLLFLPDLFNVNQGTNFNLKGYMITFGWISFIMCSFIFLFSFFLQFKNDLAMKIINICIRPLPAKVGALVNKSVHSFSEGLKIIKDKRGFSAAILLSFLIFILIILAFYFLFLSFEINTQLPILSSLLILCLTVDIFVAAFPTPGFFGSFHAACIAALHGIFGIPKAVALSYGIVAWLVIMGFTVIVGACYAIRDNISLRELTAGREEI